MAIFSSSKRKKGDQTSSMTGSTGGGGGNQASPPLMQNSTFSRSQTGSIGVGSGLNGSQQQPYSNGPGGVPGSTSSQNLNSQQIPTGLPSSLSSSAPASSSSAPFNNYGIINNNSSSAIPSTSSAVAPPQNQAPPPSGAPGHTVLYPWSQRRLYYPSSSPPPFPRYGHSVNPTASLPKGDLYIFGGLVSNAVKNDLYILGCSVGGSPGGGTGSNGPQGCLSISLVETRGEVPGPRVGHASVGVGNVLIVWGGDTKSRPEERQDDSLYLLNLNTKEWTRVKTAGPAPEGRYGHAAAMVGSRFFIFGGQKDDGGFMNDLVWFDLTKLKVGAPKWTFVDYSASVLAPPKRTGHTAVTHGDCIYIFGGTDGQYHYNDTWCYDTNTQRWTELSCIGYIPVPREGHAATLVDDVMYVFGGRGVDGKDLEDLAAFKITNQRWFMFQNMGPAPSGRSGHAMATWQNKVYVLGGESYTSTRADDPAFVHVLDTSKIKYPPDSRTPASRKSSIPASSANTSPPAPQSLTGNSPASTISNGTFPNSHPKPAGEQPPPTEDVVRRAASPTNGIRQPNGVPPPSFGQVVDEKSSPTSSQDSPPNSKIAKRVTTTAASAGVAPALGGPLRPSRPGDETDPRRATMDPSMAPNSTNLRLEERAMSPTGRAIGSRAMSPSSGIGGGGISPTTANPPLGYRIANEVNPREKISTSSPNGVNFNGARSPSPGGGRPIAPESAMDQNTASPPPSDAFYYGAGNGSNAALNGRPGSAAGGRRVKDDEELQTLRAREKWMRAALDAASRKGFVLPAPLAGEGDESMKSLGLDSVGQEGANKQLVDALLQLKQELTKAKSALAEQSQSVDERFNSANRGKASALQEASYYRAKLSALEAGSFADASKLDRERSLELEQKLAAALNSKHDLEQQVDKLQRDLSHQTEMRTSVEELHEVTSSRADAAESSYSRALTDYADLQRRAQTHENLVQEHIEQLAQHKSSIQTLTAENAELKQNLESSNSNVQTHLRAVEEMQVSLTAAHAKGDELYSAQREAATLRSQIALLQMDLDAKQHESIAAVAKADDLERLVKSTRDEYDAMKALAGGSVAEILASSRGPKTRETLSDAHAERLRAADEEVATLRGLHQQARSKSESTAAELAEIRSREVTLQAQVVQLRAEVSSVRAQHAQALDEASRHKSVAVDRDGELRAVARAREAAEVKSSLLLSIMSEHGLSTSDDDLATRFPPMSGNESPEQLHRRVQELESRLGQQSALHERELNDAQQRYRDNSTSPELAAQGAKAIEDLAALQSRHDQLDQTHQRAIAYVKGTEKMLRRMKEELTKAKTRNEELEADAGSHGGLRNELDSLRQRLGDLSSSSQKYATDNEDLQRRMATLQSDYDRQLASQQNEADAKIRDLETELTAMDQELDRLRHALEDTVAHYQELQLSVKNGGGGGGGGPDTKRLEQELAAAIAKADWLKHENEGLESRCEIAEQKISILLDHMEGTGDNFEGSPHGEAGDWSGARHESGSDRGSDYSHDPEATAVPKH